MNYSSLFALTPYICFEIQRDVTEITADDLGMRQNRPEKYEGDNKMQVLVSTSGLFDGHFLKRGAMITAALVISCLISGSGESHQTLISPAVMNSVYRMEEIAVPQVSADAAPSLASVLLLTGSFGLGGFLAHERIRLVPKWRSQRRAIAA